MSTPPPVTILIPAAGASSRMAPADKLTEPIDGQPLLRRIVERALATGAQVVVVLPKGRHPARAAALAGLKKPRLHITYLPDPDRGMSASLALGAGLVPEGAALLVLPADMPDITTADLDRIIAAARAAPGCIIRGAAQDGTPGHPVLFPPDCRAAFAGLTGDAGARALLNTRPLRLVALPDRHATTDLDTPADWAAWRGARR